MGAKPFIASRERPSGREASVSVPQECPALLCRTVWDVGTLTLDADDYVWPAECYLQHSQVASSGLVLT